MVILFALGQKNVTVKGKVTFTVRIRGRNFNELGWTVICHLPDDPPAWN